MVKRLAADASGLELVGKRRRSSGRRSQNRVRLEALEPRQLLAADLRISEVVADNRKTLDDEDGVASDWFEVYNAGNEAANLEGFHVTDDVRDRTKWTFPEVTLKPGSSLVVFASEKDRRTAGKPLHTNFKLSSGDYLGLYRPDGLTVEDAYNVLPTQYEDISYGLTQTLEDRALVTSTGTTRVLLPSSAATDVATTTWTKAEYDASSWTQLPNGIGYDADPADGDFASLIAAGGDIGAAMRGKTASAYVRNEFTLPADLPTYKSLEMTLNYDDGYIAYLNGTEIARDNGPAGTPAWNSKASAAHGGVAAVLNYPNFALADDRDDFTLKGNAAWSGDRLQLTPPQASQVGAAWTTNPVAFGADYTFEASMVYDVHSPGPANIFPDPDGIGGEGMTFVLQGGSNNLLGGPGGALGIDNSGAVFLAIELDSVASGSFDPDTTLGSHLGIDTSAAGNVARVAVPRFNGNSIFAGQPGPGVNKIYLWVGYKGETQTLDVYMATTATKPDAPTLSTKVDLGQLFAGTPQLYMGWTAATGAAYNGHDVLSWNVKTGVGELGRVPVTLDVSQHVNLLKSGKNVLAIHGLNVDANDEDFLLASSLKTQEVRLGDVGYFLTATPNALNGVSSLAPSGTVTFSRDSAIFVDSFTVEINPPAAGAAIYYTLDGTIPTEASNRYTGPIAVNGPLRIRARAVETGKSLGPITTVGYTKLDPSLASFENGEVFSSNLPMIVFDAYGLNPDTQTLKLVPTVSWFIDPGADGKATLLDTPEYTGRAGLRSRGQSSEGWPKKQYALELWEEGTDDSKTVFSADSRDKDVSVFGLPADSDWVLNGPYSDKTQLNNYLTFNWYREMGVYAPRARLVEVFVNTRRDGLLNFASSYRGTYVMLEKIKIAEDRVDIAELEPGDVAGDDVTGGYIWKKDKPGANDVAWTTALQKQEFRIVEPQKPRVATDINQGEIAPAQLNYLKGYLNEFEAALYGPNFTDPNLGYQKYIDVDSWVDTWLMVEFTKNIDGFRLSTYYHKDRNGKIKQGPAWDYNLSLANGNYLKGAYPEGWYKDGLGPVDYPYWGRLFEDPNFAQKVADRWHELRRTIFTTEELMADIDRAVGLISNGNPNLSKPAPGEPSNPISRNYKRWTTTGYGEAIYHWPNCFFNVDDCPKSPLPVENSPNGRPNSYDDYIYIMKWFVKNRTAWMDAQFVPPVQATPGSGVTASGTQVTLTAPAGYDVYYSLDGTDPRDPLVVQEERIIVPAGSPAQVTVPKDGTMMGFCDDGVRLTNPNACFMNTTYTPGTNSETWTDVTLPIGYDADGDYNSIIKTNVGPLMQNVNASAYIRIPFTLDATTARNVSSVKLSSKYDDGFVAYLWYGTLRTPVEVLRVNAGGSTVFPIAALPYNATATQSHPDEEATRWVDYDISVAASYLREGQNYLYIQALNEAANGNDFLMDFQVAVSTKRTETSPGVIKYTGPITVDKNTRVTTRGLNPTTKKWTSFAEYNYVVDAPSLAITELNYNPYAPTKEELAANPAADNDDYEFIEIKNVGAKTTNLIGVTFTGIDATLGSVELAPGELGVVVRNKASFLARYGNSAKILGEFAGGALNNAGETITMSDSLGNVLLDFAYSDSSLWPQSADGNGATLELKSANFTAADQYGKYYSWQGSTEYGGSPGKAGAGPVGVVINEVLSNARDGQSDAIELFNSSSQPVNLGGWFLSDSSQQLLKYAFPPNTVLGPGQYLVVTDKQYDADPNTGFGLSGIDGDDLWLVAAVDGKVRSIIDDVHFGSSLVGESFGRIPNGSGRLTPLLKTELGALNTTPRVGPVEITELNYSPGEPSAEALAIYPLLTSGDLEFIEIHNPQAKAVSLEEWRVRGGVAFNFAPTEQINAGETVLLVSFNPANPDNAQQLAAFRKHYKIDSSVRMFGGYTGQMASNGERITLQRPDLTQAGGAPGQYARVIEDELVFDDRAPWPTAANGQGRSLQRKGLATFGSNADSWSGLEPTPGVARFAGVKGDFDGNGVVDAKDINLLFTQIRSASPDPNYDLNGDRLVDTNDRDYMIRTVLGTVPGDTDLDRVFDSRDLVLVFQVNEYEDNVPLNSNWEEGDYNGDGDFNSQDLTFAFQAGGYVQIRVPAAAAPLDAVAAALAAEGESLEAEDEGHADALPVRRAVAAVASKPVVLEQLAAATSNRDDFGGIVDAAMSDWLEEAEDADA